MASFKHVIREGVLAVKYELTTMKILLVRATPGPLGEGASGHVAISGEVSSGVLANTPMIRQPFCLLLRQVNNREDLHGR